jgi:spermidine synthase
VGRRFFRLDEHPRVAAHAMDARQFLRSHAASGERWDLIFGDAYNGIRAIPAHLTTREFFQLARDCLTEEGVFLMNLISAVRGPRSELLAGMLATVREVFPHVEAFAVGGRREDPQNVILLCSRTDWTPMITGRYHPPGSLQARLAGARIPPHELPPAGPMFTDDFNPVDAIIARGLLIR